MAVEGRGTGGIEISEGREGVEKNPRASYNSLRCHTQNDSTLRWAAM